MTPTRRSFLGALIACGVAPLLPRAGPITTAARRSDTGIVSVLLPGAGLLWSILLKPGDAELNAPWTSRTLIVDRGETKMLMLAASNRESMRWEAGAATAMVFIPSSPLLIRCPSGLEVQVVFSELSGDGRRLLTLTDNGTTVKDLP